MIRMGARFPDDAASATSRIQLSAINRTVTDLHNMENEAGHRRAGNPTGSPGSPSENHSRGPRQAASRRRNIVSSELLYRFEWFRLLSLMIYLLVFSWIMAIIVIGISDGPLSVPFYVMMVLTFVLVFSCINIWASINVLSLVDPPDMRSYFDRRLRLDQERWQIAFRVLWYLWYIALLGACVYWMIRNLIRISIP